MQIEKEFFTGLNYWGSKHAINMWEHFEKDSIEEDLRRMKEAGVTHLRVFPLWPVFQPLHALYEANGAYEYTFGEDPLPETPAGRAGVSEEACRKFDIFCDLAEQYGMKLMVGLITGQMSFRIYAPPAFEGKNLLTDPTVIKWQLRFVRYFVERFKDKTAIFGWDLGNEVTCMMEGDRTKQPDSFYVWSSAIASTIKACDPSRPVISGLDNSGIEHAVVTYHDIGEICDIHTTHPYNIFATSSVPVNTMLSILDLPFKCRLGEDLSGIPNFVQEFGAIGYMNCSKKAEAGFYRASMLSCLAHGCHGVMWWCAFDQGHHNFAPYRWNAIGSDYGFFDKNLQEKPVAEENREFQRLLSLLPQRNLPAHRTDATILVQRDGQLDMMRTTYLLAKQANLDVNFQFVSDPLKDSKLYILPCIQGYHAVHKQKLDEILKKVEDGAVLYLSADEGLFRQIPELTGVDIAYRERVSETKTMHLNGTSLPISTTFFYTPEGYRAEVLASDEAGVPVFFRYSRGKGYVCFLTLPLERCVKDKKGAFHAEDAVDYSCVYRELARIAGIRRVCDSDNPFLRLTEHPIDEDSLYVMAINYNNKSEEARLSVADGYEISALYGDAPSDGKICLRENDAVLLKLVRNRNA